MTDAGCLTWVYLLGMLIRLSSPHIPGLEHPLEHYGANEDAVAIALKLVKETFAARRGDLETAEITATFENRSGQVQYTITYMCPANGEPVDIEDVAPEVDDFGLE